MDVLQQRRTSQLAPLLVSSSAPVRSSIWSGAAWRGQHRNHELLEIQWAQDRKQQQPTREVSVDSCSTCLRSRASSVVRTVICVSSNEAASKKRIGTKSLRKTPWSRLMHALPKRYMFCMKVLLVMRTTMEKSLWDIMVWRFSLHSFVTNARWFVDETCRLGRCARIVHMGSTAKGSAHPFTNIAIALSPKVNMFSGSCFACFATTRDTSLRRAIFRALAVRALCELSESVNFCYVSSVALAIWRASRSNSVRSKDRLPLARGAVDPGRKTAGIETPSGSFSTKAARSASAAVGFVTLMNCDCTSFTITARSGKSTGTKNVAQIGVGRDSSNSSAQGRK